MLLFPLLLLLVAADSKQLARRAAAREKLMLGDYQGAVDLLDDIIFAHIEARVSWAKKILGNDGRSSNVGCPLPEQFPTQSVPVRRVDVAELSKPGFAFGNVPMVIEGAVPDDWNARTWPWTFLRKNTNDFNNEVLVQPLETDESSQYLLNRWTAREPPPQRFADFARRVLPLAGQRDALRHDGAFANARLELPTHPKLFQTLARDFSWPVSRSFKRFCRNLSPRVLLDANITRDPGVRLWRKQVRDLHADARRGPLREEDRALGRLLLKWPSRSGVWVSDSGLHTVPHHDWADGLLLQVHGAKHAVLLPPDDGSGEADNALRLLMAVHNAEHDLLTARLSAAGGYHRAVGVPPLARLLRLHGTCFVRHRLAYTLLDELGVERHETVLRRGDALFIPRTSAHDITSLMPAETNSSAASTTREGTISIRFYPITCGDTRTLHDRVDQCYDGNDPILCRKVSGCHCPPKI